MLFRSAPGIDITILDAETPGFGASGRNGGWCVGEFAGQDAMLANPEKRSTALQMVNAIHATVDEVGAVCGDEQIDCHFHKGGCLIAAISPFHAQQLRDHINTQRGYGIAETDAIWIEAGEAAARVGVCSNHGALYTPHCAVIHPLRLVQGLVRSLQRLGVSIIANTAVTALRPGEVETSRGNIACDAALRATEAYTDSISGSRRELIPIYSMMVATEPLSEATWRELGLHNRESIASAQRTVTYGQRTADGRLAFGARGGYLYGSGVRRQFAPDDPRLRVVAKIMRDLFPVLADCRVEYAWGGMLGVPRSWTPGVQFDRSRRLGWAGGYVGEGVAASNLAARTLADLVLERDTELTALPWVSAPQRRWEPEPMRWLGCQLGSFAERSAERYELAHGRSSRVAGRIANWLSS